MCSGQRGEINNQILGVKGLKRTNRHKKNYDQIYNTCDERFHI